MIGKVAHRKHPDDKNIARQRIRLSVRDYRKDVKRHLDTVRMSRE